MRRSAIPSADRWHRMVVATVLAVGVLLMTGPPVSAAAPAGDATSAVSAMTSMDGMDGMSVAAVLLPAGTAPGGAAVTDCAAMCGGLLEACLAALTLLVTAAMALPGLRRLVRAGLGPVLAGRVRWWVLGESPPWSVPSLAQLSVQRV